MLPSRQRCIRRSAKRLIEKPLHNFQPRGIEELWATVRSVVDQFELARALHPLVGPFEFMRLVDRHLGVLVAVDQQQRGIVGVDVRDWAGEFRQDG